MPDAEARESEGVVVAKDAAPSPEEAAQIAAAISRALRRAANKSRAPARLIAGGGGFRARRGERAFRLFLLSSFGAFVLLPFLVASLYWGLVASDQYVAEAKFALRSAETSTLAALGVNLQAHQQADDAQVVVKYILSRAMADALDKKLGLRAIFSRTDIDYLSRLDPGEPAEKLEKYWRRRVDARVETLSGVVSLQVRAFAPHDAVTIAQNVVELSEKLVNDLSSRLRADALTQARAEASRAQKRMEAAMSTLRVVRDAQGVFDAPAAAQSLDRIITRLRMELAASEESLALQASASAVDSPQLRLLNARVESLKKQIDDYTAQIASTQRDGSLAGRAGVLAEAQAELSVAQQQHTAAERAYQAARVDLEAQRAYLTLFLAPSLPQKPLYPRRWLEWAIIVAPSALAWALLAGVASLARDHMAK
jgi:capsular polysaccharide transport system permease protein